MTHPSNKSNLHHVCLGIPGCNHLIDEECDCPCHKSGQKEVCAVCKKEIKSKSLWGCSAKGVIYTPNGMPVFWLPMFLVRRLHNWLNT